MARNTGLGESSTHYLIEGVKYPSVTHVIKSVMNGGFGPASWWGFKLGVQAMGGEYEKIKGTSGYKEHNPNAQRDKGSKRGQQSHGIMEALATGDEGLIASLETITGYDEAVMKWFADRHADWETIACEEMVYSKNLGYAGTLDLARTKDGRFQIVDLKTHKGDPRFEDLLQIAAYGRAYAEMYGTAEPEQLVVVAHEDGTYTESDAWVDPDTFEHILAVYDAMEGFK